MIQWHQLFAKTLELALTPVDIEVSTEVEVMIRPPRADIVLLRRRGNRWTKAQRARLPDGIRDDSAKYVRLEFKYRESFNRDVLMTAAGYDVQYRNTKNLSQHALSTFIVMSGNPSKKTLKHASYRPGPWPGVMVSEVLGYDRLPIILLNQLELTPHNLAFKLFASQLKEKNKTINALKSNPVRPDEAYEKWLSGLYYIWQKEETMTTAEITPEKVMELGQLFSERYLESLPPEERLKGMSPKEQLIGLSPKDQLIGLVPEDRLNGLSDEEVLAMLNKLFER